MGRTGMLTAAALAGSGWMLVASPGPAFAACHAFEVDVEPAEVAEGGVVTVTVSRDAGVAPSSVDVSAESGTATSGQDFAAFGRTVAFTNETSQSFPLQINDDGAVEGPESFQLHLSNPQGCAVNPNLRVGEDATVTIADNDTAVTTTAPPATGATTTLAPTTTAPTTTVSSSTSTSSASSSTTTTDVGSTSTTSDEGDEAASPIADRDGQDDDGGGSPAVLFLVFAILVVGSGIGYLVWRRSNAGQPPA